MEIVFKTSNFDQTTIAICISAINSLFEIQIGQIDELKYFVICDTDEKSFSTTINEYAQLLNSEAYAENNNMYQVAAKALHGINDDGDLSCAIVIKSGLILCLLNDLLVDGSNEKEDSDESMQWIGLATVLHEVGHIIDYIILSKVDPFFTSTKICFDLSDPQEKREYILRSCVNLWSEYYADYYVFQTNAMFQIKLRENESQLRNTIINYYGEDVTVEERIFRILYFYVRLLAQHGLEYCHTVLKDSILICYSGFLEAFGKRIISLHKTYPDWDINSSFDETFKLYSLLLAYEKSRQNKR